MATAKINSAAVPNSGITLPDMMISLDPFPNGMTSVLSEEDACSLDSITFPSTLHQMEYHARWIVNQLLILVG